MITHRWIGTNRMRWLPFLLAGIGLAIVPLGIALYLTSSSAIDAGRTATRAQQLVEQNQLLITQLQERVTRLHGQDEKAQDERARLLQLIRGLQRQVRHLGGTPLTLEPSRQAAPDSGGGGASPSPTPSRHSQPRETSSPPPSPSKSPTPKPSPSPSVCPLDGPICLPPLAFFFVMG